MTQDEIIEMARQAGIYHAQDSEYHWDGLTDQKIIERTPDSAKDIAWRNRRTFEILKPFAKLVAEKALAQPEQKPVAWICHGADGKHDIDFYQDEIDAIPVATMLYTTPSQRKPLTDEQIETLWQNTSPYYDHQDFARSIKQAHGIKENT